MCQINRYKNGEGNIVRLEQRSPLPSKRRTERQINVRMHKSAEPASNKHVPINMLQVPHLETGD